MWIWLGLAGVVVVGAKVWAFSRWRQVAREVDELETLEQAETGSDVVFRDEECKVE